jgi:hypothetical protein
MATFIIMTLSAVLLALVLWIWLGLRRKSRQQGESFAGKTTVSELNSKERHKT